MTILGGINPEDDDTILFIDETQRCENFISDLKYIHENHPKANIICAGSLLGVKLKRFNKSFPVGQIEYLYMYPMSFDEFLMAFKKDNYISIIKECYDKNKSIAEPIHNELIGIYKLFLITGGMPEAVKKVAENKESSIVEAKNIIGEITNSYLKDMNDYVSNNTETLRIRALYNSMPNQIGNASHKFQISKIENNSRRREFETPLSWLLSSNMVIDCYGISTPKKPLKLYRQDNIYKLYLSDVGILTNLLDIDLDEILLDKLGTNKGIIAENYVACELMKCGFSLYYWANPEVDFVEKIGDDIIPIEVKSSDNTQSKALRSYTEKFDPKYSIRISTKNFGYNPKSKVKSIPLYAVFCIKSISNSKEISKMLNKILEN